LLAKFKNIFIGVASGKIWDVGDIKSKFIIAAALVRESDNRHFKKISVWVFGNFQPIMVGETDYSFMPVRNGADLKAGDTFI